MENELKEAFSLIAEQAVEIASLKYDKKVLQAELEALKQEEEAEEE